VSNLARAMGLTHRVAKLENAALKRENGLPPQE
jgi:hypothetical protein